ncbi:MAG: peptidylprolyl isomerase [Rhodospirillales bacterium]|nr:peptidylprolyl isomerase [Rhodospirillales bacterium]
MKLVAVIFAILLAVPVNSASGQNVERIAAIVNDEVISFFDLEMRLSLIIAGSRLPNNKETRQRLAPQILRRLIDESLQMQEAKRLNIRVTDSDLDHAFANIERQNQLKPGALDAYLESVGVDKLALIAQVEPEIAWAKVIGRRIRPQIRIGSEEIDETIARLNEAKGKPEHLLAEIFLRVDDPSGERGVKQLANRIMQQLKNGASFPALARNFSQNAAAAAGGDLGWIRQGELGAELDAAIEKMKPSSIAGPLRTISGYHILLLRQRRTAKGLEGPEVSVDLQQLFFPLPRGTGSEESSRQMEQASAIAAKASSCKDMESLAAEIGTPQSGSLGTVKLASLPDALRTAVQDLAIGTPSNPVQTANGAIVLMVCERHGDAEPEALRKRIENMLYVQRRDAAARRYLRDLRRAAFIDVRL